MLQHYAPNERASGRWLFFFILLFQSLNYIQVFSSNTLTNVIGKNSYGICTLKGSPICVKI